MPSSDYRSSHVGQEKSRIYEEDIYREGSYDEMLWRIERELLIKEIRALQKKVGKIQYLDFACGTGRIISFLEQSVEESYGIDVSSAMLAKAREKVKKSELIYADLTANDVLKDKTFDLITAFRFFLNAEPELRASAFSVLRTKLKDEKSIFIFNMHGNIVSHRLFTKFWYLLRGRRLATSSFWEAQRLVSENGLEVIHWYGIGVLPKIFYRYVSSRFLLALDKLFFSLPIFKYVSYDLVFVCRKI